ncbi:MAG: hypothetical protein K5931_01965 [Lachnospiraceae bacterium]|nr:hypothetical protein [Lachnospiraceae bacterium]
MKAVVIDIEKNIATILGANGIFSQIDNNGYQIGEELEIELVEKAKKSSESFKSKVMKFEKTFSRQATRIAAAFLVLVLGAGSVTAYAMPCSKVTVDVNPSIEYGVNIFNTVVSTKAYNEAGTAILSNMEVKGKSLDKAIDITLDTLADAEYIDQETDVVMTVESKVVSNTQLEKEVMTAMESWNDKKAAEPEKKKSIKPNAVIVTEDIKSKAKEKNMSPGMVYIENQINNPVDQGQPQGEINEDNSGNNGGNISAGGSKDKKQNEAVKDSESKEKTENNETKPVNGDKKPSDAEGNKAEGASTKTDTTGNKTGQNNSDSSDKTKDSKANDSKSKSGDKSSTDGSSAKGNNTPVATPTPDAAGQNPLPVDGNSGIISNPSDDQGVVSDVPLPEVSPGNGQGETGDQGSVIPGDNNNPGAGSNIPGTDVGGGGSGGENPGGAPGGGNPEGENPGGAPGGGNPGGAPGGENFGGENPGGAPGGENSGGENPGAIPGGENEEINPGVIPGDSDTGEASGEIIPEESSGDWSGDTSSTVEVNSGDISNEISEREAGIVNESISYENSFNGESEASNDILVDEE